MSSLLKDIILSAIPWFTYSVFMLGVLWKVYRWVIFLKITRPLGIITGRLRKYTFHSSLKRLLIDYILQLKLLRGSKSVWMFSWLLFHITLFIILLGHLSLIGIWRFQLEFSKTILPTIIGSITLLALLLLFLRRLLSQDLRQITGMGVFISITLLILVIMTGTMMRFLPHTPLRTVVNIPLLPAVELSPTPAIELFLLHVLFAQIFVMYLPYSPLLHIIFTPFLQLAGTIMNKSIIIQRIALDTCMRCGMCVKMCPTYGIMSDSKLHPIMRMRGVLKVMSFHNVTANLAKDIAENVFRCTACRACSEICPMGIDPAFMIELTKIGIVEGLRYGET